MPARVVLAAASALALSSCRPTEPPPAAAPSSPAPTTTASGLVWTELRPGNGEPLAPGDLAVVAYQARRADGEVFEDRTDRDQPVRIPVAQSNPIFWQEALQLMRVGGRYALTVPARLLWPEALRPPWLPVDGTAAYDVEVLRAVRQQAWIKPDPAHVQEGDGYSYQVLAPGDAGTAPAQPTDWVAMHFTAFDAHGNVVDSSRPLERPVRFRPSVAPSTFLERVSSVMRPGSRWTCLVPAKLAWRQPHEVLRPDDETCWVVELLSIEPPLPLPEFARPPDDALTTTASGLRVQILTPGSGPLATAADTVDVHYVGWRADGSVVDSSYAFGRPTRLAVDGLVPGWREGVQLLRPGGAAYLVVPAHLAYGRDGLPQKHIEPDTELVFRVELVSIVR
ncbi:MAG: FKBP-type peptidyl-prolyl cis-trans isomerase [Planctomycetota bacterium]